MRARLASYAAAGRNRVGAMCFGRPLNMRESCKYAKSVNMISQMHITL